MLLLGDDVDVLPYIVARNEIIILNLGPTLLAYNLPL